MSRSLRRGALAATALVFSLATLSACGAGNNAQTLGVRPDNAATSVDVITIQNATVVTQPEAEAEGLAVVTGTVFNNGKSAQTLDSVKLPGTSATVKLSPAKGSGPVTVPAHGSVQLGGAGNASAVIENGREAAKNGDAQQVVFTFSKTGDVGLRAFVWPADSFFKDVGPSVLPTPPGSSVTPSGTPAAGAEGESAGGENTGGEGATGGENGQQDGPADTTPSDSSSASHDAAG
ncbi:DUF461 domain-containing protein [Streptomyces sp. NPDC093099]|uniref:DUF461 domain-containing protein n=1 Tax=Streptomyces sp. NPDC093099 TaxID=3366028 RepID=UPI00381E5AE1